MMSFTDWDIVRNLLLAARWTLLLSLLAVILASLATLPQPLLPLTNHLWPNRFVRFFVVVFMVILVQMQLFSVFFAP